MKHSFTKYALAALLAIGTVANASAVTILGYLVANGANGTTLNPGGTNESGFANHILDMALNTTDPSPIPGSSGTPYYIRNGNADVGSGNITNQVQGSTGATNIGAGYEYAFGRYDGPNGGYILWYLGGAAFDAPTTSNGGGNWGDSYGLSHFTAFNFNSDTPPPRVPDGGATVALLGLGLGALALMRRFFSK